MVKPGVLDTVQGELRAASGKFSKKKPRGKKLRNRHFWLFSDDFVWGFYEGVLIGKCQSLVRDSGLWPAARLIMGFLDS